MSRIKDITKLRETLANFRQEIKNKEISRGELFDKFLILETNYAIQQMNINNTQSAYEIMREEYTKLQKQVKALKTELAELEN